MPEEVIYFVSDTHLGDGSGADRFLYPNQLMDLLARIDAERGAHLVLLGDIMELWAASMEAVLIHHAPIFGAIARLSESHPVTYVVGNHDCLPWYYFLGMGTGWVRITDRFVAANGALVALHGHQYDPFNQVGLASDGEIKAPWTRKLVKGLGVLERLGGAAGGAAIHHFTEALSDAALRQAREILEHESPGERGYPADEHRYIEAAAGLMRQGARFVVMGHTHHPLVVQWGARRYVNTGSWVWDRYPPTYARFARGELELFSGEDHRPYRPTAQPPTPERKEQAAG